MLHEVIIREGAIVSYGPAPVQEVKVMFDCPENSNLSIDPKSVSETNPHGIIVLPNQEEELGISEK